MLGATIVAVAAVMLALLATGATPASAQPAPIAPTVTAPEVPTPGAPDSTEGADSPDAQVNIDLGVDDSQGEGGISNPVLIILLLTVLSVAPSLLILVSGFTRIVIVLSLVRNALGLQSIPPNQVIVGLSLFLAVFVMTPTLKVIYDDALQPLMNDEITQEQAWDRAQVPLKEFMLDNTRSDELATFVDAAEANGEAPPATPEETPLTTLIPAFLLSELKTAFIIGFVVFVPFLVLDLVVSAVLMSLGMMMLPPVFVSLPFKILLFVMVGGWTLVAESLLRSFH
jgi:flagellar biosynthetic protein FliP